MATPPAPAQVGVPVTKETLNAKLGGATQSVRKAAVALKELQDWAAPYTAQQLVDLYKFTMDEATLFLSSLRGATETPALLTAVNAFQFLNKTWGN